MAKSTFPPLQSAKMSHTEQLKCCYTIFNNTHHTLPLAFEIPTLVCPRAIVAPLVVTNLKLPAWQITHYAGTELNGQVIPVAALLRRCQYF